jgi:hypothetical protein
MRNPPLELDVHHAVVSELGSNATAIISCQTNSGQQVLLRMSHATLALLCSSAGARRT